MNYYQHHIGDYDSHTAHLTWLEDAAYRRLMCLYYRTEKALPADGVQVCRLIRAHTKLERESVQQILAEFFELRDDGYHSDRCDQEIAAYQARAETARVNGGRGGRPKSKLSANPAETQSVITGFDPETHDKAHQEPVTKNQEPVFQEGVIQEDVSHEPVSHTKRGSDPQPIAPKSRSSFVQPDLETVKGFFAAQGREDQAGLFFSYYQSNGWRVGKNNMKDWHAAAIGWIARAASFGPSSRAASAGDKWNFDDILPTHTAPIRTVRPANETFEGLSYAN